MRTAAQRGVRGRVAVAGVGESGYYKRGESPEPEQTMLLRAILAAADDAGVAVDEIDGFVSFGGEQHEPPQIATALGIPDLRLSAMQATNSGGGSGGHIAIATAAIVAGLADCVVVYRAIAQPAGARFGMGQFQTATERPTVSGYGELAHMSAHGVFSAAQKFAWRGTQLIEKLGVPRSTLRAVAMAAYHHAQSNPRAVMFGRPLSEDTYESSRWIAEPYRLFDCCMENDCAAAMLLVPAERAKDLRHRPVHILAASAGGAMRGAAGDENVPDLATGGFKTLVNRLFSEARVGPSDVDVVQIYDNFSAGVVYGLLEHGFCTPETAGDVLTFENLIAPTGNLPLNTSGGNSAEAYVQSMNMHIDCVRQLRGDAVNQVPDAKIALSAGGPMTPVSTSIIFGHEDTL